MVVFSGLVVKESEFVRGEGSEFEEGVMKVWADVIKDGVTVVGGGLKNDRSSRDSRKSERTANSFPKEFSG